MTKKERQKIQNAMILIMSENGFEEGMMMLGDLCGIITAYHKMGVLKSVSVLSIIANDYQKEMKNE